MSGQLPIQAASPAAWPAAQPAAARVPPYVPGQPSAGPKQLDSPTADGVSLGQGSIPQAGTVPPRSVASANLEPSRLPDAMMGDRGDCKVSPAFREDARLNDVCFVDSQCGWAVGDRGTVWHTGNGGREWSLQETGVKCPLHSVHFLDRDHGWAVGGYTHPFTRTGSGLVLMTADGGATWKAKDHTLLPILKKVRFFDLQHGWAVGCSSAACPSGLFLSDSGGRSWNPTPGARQPGWRDGDFLDPQNGVLVGQDGSAAEVRSGRVVPSGTPRFGLRGPADVQLVPPSYGWLVGEGGLAMLTRDLGHSWQTPPAPLPAAVAGQFDFNAMSVRQTKVWIAGSPGTRVFYTPDAGLSWQALRTNQNAPLRAIDFADDVHGWAVGDFGTILATEDGGQTWRRQRAGGTRAALMTIFADGHDLPLELIAKLSGEEGYLSVAEIIGRSDPGGEPEQGVPCRDRIHEAVVALGGCAAHEAWRFPVTPEALKLKGEAVVEQWNRVNDGLGSAYLSAHLVRQIRTYRPEVIVTCSPSQTGEDPLGDLLNDAVMTAIRDAADPTSQTDQVTQAGLEPWTVTRVFSSMAPGLSGTTSVSTAQLATRLGCSLADAASESRGLIDTELGPQVETLGFRLLVDEHPSQGGEEGFFTGIGLQPGGEARRQWTDPPPANIEQIRHMAERRRHTQAIIKRAGADTPVGAALVAQTEELTRGLDDDRAAAVLHHMAQTYFAAGQWQMAQGMFERLASQYPAHPLARSAMLWLVHYYVSDEAAWRVNGNQRLRVQNVATRAVDPNELSDGVKAAAWQAGQGGPFDVRQASAPAIDTSQLEDRQQMAASLGKTVERLLPDLYAEPSLRFSLAVSDRKRGYPAQAERYLMVLQRGTSQDDWWACAQGERWMSAPAGIPPKQVINCVIAPTRPHLDGQLDDGVWQRAKAVELKDPNRAPPATERPEADGQGANLSDAAPPQVATAKLAYDQEFLYVALRCPRAVGVDYSGVRGIRPRDPDLSNRDRVELFLDIDRDFATYYQLTVDHRGYVTDSCWTDATWNPTWFVASDDDKQFWTAEAAIPLDQLTGNYPAPRTVWALGLRRITPGVGVEGWSAAGADAVKPEEFGYLIFD
ncbi:MAG: YCF48-related protein [Thermoguttaceae bacterium]